MFKRLLILFSAFIALTASAQNLQFQVFSVSGGPVCTYIIRNSGNVDAKLVAVSMRIFHQRPNLDFRPVSGTPGFSKYQYTGKFTSTNKSFACKTVCILPQDSLIQQASQIDLLEITNYNTGSKDSLMAAGITVFCKVNGRDTSVEAFPGGATPCPGKHVFLNAGTASSGLKEGGFGFFNLAAGSCQNNLNLIVYDGATLARKAVTGMTPICQNGRKWSTFGFKSDSFIYYSFDITTPAGRKSLDSLTLAMNSNDYAVLGNLNPINLSYFDSCSSALQRIGYASPWSSDNTGFMVMAGRKGLSPGQANIEYCQSSHMNCYTSLEQTLLAGETGSSLNDFGSCFEPSELVLEKGWPVSSRRFNIDAIKVFPNPSNTQWSISSGKIAALQLLDASGKSVNPKINMEQGGASIDASSIQNGIYMLVVHKTDGSKTTVRLVRY